MIGAWGLLEQSSFVLILVAFALTVVIAIRRSPRTRGGFSGKGIILMLVLVLVPAVSTWNFAKELQNHLFFASLTPEKVASFSVGTQRITDQNSKILIVQALRDVQWFSPHHGGWGLPTDFRIKLTSGQERYFRVAAYSREPGAIIDFAVPDGRSGLHSGYAFSRTLPSALKEIGIDLRH